MVLSFSVLALLGFSCGGGGAASVTDETSLGIRVSIPESVYSNGLYLRDRTVKEPAEIRETLLRWVDERVLEWISGHPGEQGLLDEARGAVISIYDHWSFPCSVSLSGRCAGTYENGVVAASIYSQWSNYYYPSHNAPVHTVLYGDEMAELTGSDGWRTGKWYAGDMCGDGIGLSVIPHELDHAIGIGHD